MACAKGHICCQVPGDHDHGVPPERCAYCAMIRGQRQMLASDLMGRLQP